MHNNYERAICTVVHDMSLLNQYWIDSASACVVLVLSPWFTRGWTSLELAVSRNVKVLFKSSDGLTPDIRDLDEEILAKGPGTSSRLHWLATCLIRRIRRLLDVRVSLGDILAVLRPRVTAWNRDRCIIASLLARVPDPDFSLSEARITQRLIEHVGFVDSSFVLHGRPTMTDYDRYSWCPTDLDDVPINIRTGRMYHAGDIEAYKCLTAEDSIEKASGDFVTPVHPDGSIVDHWFTRPVNLTDIRIDRIKPFANDLSVVLKVETSLLDWKSCMILYKGSNFNNPFLTRVALLVIAIGIVMESGSSRPMALDCRYVGAIHDHRPKDQHLLESHSWLAESNQRLEPAAHDNFADRFGNPTTVCKVRLGKDGGRRGIDASDTLNEFLDGFRNRSG